ncbi:MAG: tetratricopeptide repeat protein [Candidatus Melainabacteria bacterium]|nr:tetratricopeptide repeat protein [Candidatus Melainabacteria bacterium]
MVEAQGEILAKDITATTAGVSINGSSPTSTEAIVDGVPTIQPVGPAKVLVQQRQDTRDLEALKLQVASAIAQREYTQIIPLLTTLITKQRQLLGETNQEVASRLCDLADWYKLAGDYASAHKLYRQALDLKERALGAEHPSVAAILTHLALIHMDEHSYDQAEAFFKQVLAIDRKLFGSQHPLIANDLQRYAVLLAKTKRFDQAKQMYAEANAIRIKLNQYQLV